MTQQGDVILYQSNDDGEIDIVNGLVAMDGGLQTAVYLSLFGGNEGDDGLENNIFGWWGNIGENIQSRQYVSRTQNLIYKIPATSANLLKLNDAVNSDLQWIVNDNVATSIDVEVTIPKLNKVNIVVNIISIDLEKKLNFTANWKASI